jgi:hypothetical protein
MKKADPNENIDLLNENPVASIIKQITIVNEDIRGQSYKTKL